MAKELQNWLKRDVEKLKKISKLEYYSKGFFRDPLRPQYINRNYFYSPADGIILYQKEMKPDEEIIEVKGKHFTLKKLFEDDSWDKKCLVIGVFMTQYDVHINRVPYTGVMSYKTLPPISTKNKPMLYEEEDIFEGKIKEKDMGYLFYNERAINEVICPQINYKYYIFQIADAEVDVISHFYDRDKYMIQNSRFAMIRYGSQVDLVLPLPLPCDYKLLIKDNWHVRAGIDKLIQLNWR